MSTRSQVSLSFLRQFVLTLLWTTFALSRLRPIYWEDVWWHLGTGRYILSHHRVPTVDVFSWTARGAPWFNHEWLYQVLLYSLVHVMGLAGVTLVKTIFLLTALYFVDRRLRFWKASVVERVLCLGLVFLGGWPFWVERADLSSLAFLSALFWELDRQGGDAAGWRRRRRLWVFLFALWANTHGGFVLGLLFMGLQGLCLIKTKPRDARSTLSWTAFCILATTVNPHGLGMYLRIFKTIQSNVTQIYEWLPPGGLGYTFFFFALAVALISVLFKKKETWKEIFPAVSILALAVLACRHARFVHFFMIGAFPYAFYHWISGSVRARAVRWWPYEKSVLLGLAFLLLAAADYAARMIQGGIDARSSGYVKEVCDFIQRENVQGPFYNEYKFGSYWIWRFNGNPPVFLDGRAMTVVGYGRLMDLSVQARASPQQWLDYLNGFGIQAAVVRYPQDSRRIGASVLDRYFPRKSWALIYWDDLCLLFLRRDSIKNAGLLLPWEFRFAKPDLNPESLADQLAKGLVNRPALQEELRKNLLLHPGSSRTRLFLNLLESKT